MKIFLSADLHVEYACQLAKGLGLKNEVVISLNREKGEKIIRDFPGFMENSTFEYCFLPHYKTPDLRQIPAVFYAILPIIKQKPQVIHTQLGNFVESFAAVWLSCRFFLPLVVTWHDIGIHPGDYLPVRRQWTAAKTGYLADCIIVHGHGLAKKLGEEYGIDEKIIRVIPHGNYDIYYHALTSPLPDPEPFTVLLFGRMNRYKGLDVLKNAVWEISGKIPALKVILAGKGPELDRLEPELKKSGHYEIINRHIEAKEVGQLFSRASLVVLPYLEASQSGPLNLAFSFKRPVVATSVGAIPETIENGKQGFLVKPGSAKALAGAIIKILENPALAKKMGEGGRQKASTLLEWSENIAIETKKAYEQAIEIRKTKKRPGKISWPQFWDSFKTAHSPFRP